MPFVLLIHHYQNIEGKCCYLFI